MADGYSGVEIAVLADMVQPDNRPSTRSPSDWRTKPTKDKVESVRSADSNLKTKRA